MPATTIDEIQHIFINTDKKLFVMKISQISPENRPIERLNKLGASTLSDAELFQMNWPLTPSS